jgi:diguanylate cyclase (GGDEF)-like protein
MTSRGDTDTSDAVELAPRIWWVGSLLPGDQFQCHVYLVEQGDQSVLIDPGSALNTEEVIRRIDAVVGVANVRWPVCSHSDPDILGALPALVARGLHPEATIVTHWRDEALIRHCGTPLTFWRIEEHEWQLELEDRALQFVFTPYAHFAGAFCTFDEVSGTLFSSDLFGGFSDDKTLFATSDAYFDSMRAFHEHYMPSRDILDHALGQLRPLPIERIAPQHGLIIPHRLVPSLMDKLSELQCGIYLLAHDDPGLAFLLAANETVRDVVDILVRETEFSIIASHIAEVARHTLGADYLELWAPAGTTLVQFDKSDGFAGHAADPPGDIVGALAGTARSSKSRMILALRPREPDRTTGVVVLGFDRVPTLDRPTRGVLTQVSHLVEVGLEREMLRRISDLEREEWHDQAMHDPLTGLYNRVSLVEAARRLFGLDDRNEDGQIAALMMDVDHFKDVNDRFGHPMGDRVLRHVARSISQEVRLGDIAFRYGGEEFLVLLNDVDSVAALAVAERIRTSVAAREDDQPNVTMSVGAALRLTGEGIDHLVERADRSLYEAKAGGRDCIVLSPAESPS